LNYANKKTFSVFREGFDILLISFTKIELWNTSHGHSHRHSHKHVHVPKIRPGKTMVHNHSSVLVYPDESKIIIKNLLKVKRFFVKFKNSRI